MLRPLAIFAARRTPAYAKRWIHRHRLFDRMSRNLFSMMSSVGQDSIQITGGIVKGLSLASWPHVSDAHISGAYELETQQALDRLLKPDMICYDLGASIGYFSLLLARKARHVYAFEPAPHALTEIHR